MPDFRDRPWTWVFLILTLGVDLHILVVDTETSGPWDGVVYAQLGVVNGQMVVVGAWTVLGSAHRSIRPFVFFVAMAIHAILVIISVQEPFSMRNWNRSVAIVFVFQLTAALAALVTLAMQTRLVRRLRNQDVARKDRRFRLVELLAWMGVVALATSLLRNPEVAPLLKDSEAASWLAMSTASGFCCALLAGRSRPPRWFGIPVAVGVVTMFLQVVSASANSAPLRLLPGVVFAYVGCYLACCILDDRKRSTNAAADSD